MPREIEFVERLPKTATGKVQWRLLQDQELAKSQCSRSNQAEGVDMSNEPKQPAPHKIPRSKENDYSREVAAARRDFVKERTGVALEHVGQYSFDPAVLPGNVENFSGVAQVPIGVAGPLRLNGEHAQGDFYVPLATTEGTLVASYNRGMRVLSECGGVKTTVVEDSMQRAPVFIFDDALQAREFGPLGDGPLRRHQGRGRNHHARR